MLSDQRSDAGFFARWRNPMLALICFLLAICCFNVASKLGCGCAHGDSDAADLNSANYRASH
jgi:hypothetical protein